MHRLVPPEVQEQFQSFSALERAVRGASRPGGLDAHQFPPFSALERAVRGASVYRCLHVTTPRAFSALERAVRGASEAPGGAASPAGKPFQCSRASRKGCIGESPPFQVGPGWGFQCSRASRKGCIRRAWTSYQHLPRPFSALERAVRGASSRRIPAPAIAPVFQCSRASRKGCILQPGAARHEGFAFQCSRASRKGCIW